MLALWPFSGICGAGEARRAAPGTENATAGRNREPLGAFPGGGNVAAGGKRETAPSPRGTAVRAVRRLVAEDVGIVRAG